ncbi:MAG: PAS domain S-box protein [Syntrophomonadaceae bacterium]
MKNKSVDLTGELVQLRQRVAVLEGTLRAEQARRREIESHFCEKDIDIDDIKRSEAILENEERLQALMKYAPGLVFLKDEAGRYVYLNQTYEKQFAVSKDWYGKTDFDFWSAENAELFRAHDKSVLESDQVLQCLEDSTDLGGDRYCWLCYKFPFVDSQNRRYLAGIGVDATAWVLAEETLQRARQQTEIERQRFQDLVETNADFIWEMDTQGRFTYCSPQAEELWGFKTEDLLGFSPFDLMPPDTREPVLSLFTRATPTAGVVKEYAATCYDGRGQLKHIETNALPFFDAHGSLLGFRGVTRDVTGRKRAEQAQAERERQYRELVEYAPTGIYEIDLQTYRFISVNDAMCRLTGYSRDELLAMDPSDLVDQRFQEVYQVRAKQWLDGEKPAPGLDYMIRTKDDREVWATLEVSLTSDQNGQPLGATVVVHDVSGRKQAEKKARLEQDITAGINRILQEALSSRDEEELGMACLNVALELTGSSMGFIGELSREGYLDDIAVSATGWDSCRMPGGRQSFGPKNRNAHGICATVLQQGRALISNHPGSHPDSIGLPDWHPPLNSFIGAPLLENGQVVGMVGLGNKGSGFNETDLYVLEKLAPSIVEVLMHKRAQEEVRRARDRLEKRIEERTWELHRLNQSLIQTMESITDAFVTLDQDWTVTYWNKAAEKMFKTSSRDIIGRSLWEVFPESVWSDFYRNYHLAVTENVPMSFAARVDCADCWVEVRAYPSPTGLTVYLNDITERRLTEEALRESEDKFKKVFENSPNLIAVLRMEDNRFIDANQNFLALMELSRDEVIGRTPENLHLSSEDPETIKKILAGLNENGLVQDTEVRVRTRSGRLVTLCASEAIVTLNNKEHRAVMMRDVTRQKMLEAEMARLDRLNLIGEMAAGIGHEIRNPMTAVRGFLQMLGAKEQYADDLAFFELMIEELDRANSIISEFMGMARDKMVHLKPCRLDQLVTSLYPMIKSEANLREVGVQLDLNEMPPALIDQNELRQLILNMSRNALEAMSSHGTVTIGTRWEGDEVILFIRDEGLGLAPEIVDKLGTPFLTTKDNGTGLGLAVCYSIAARHQGRIDYETGPTGTTFYVSFPVAG